MEPRTTGRAHSRTASNGDLSTEIYYEVFGDPDHPTLLLVNGLGSQLISYRPEFCQRFVDAGYQVIRFDNRDVGLSSKSEGRPPSLKALLAEHRAGRPMVTPYTLADMAGDAVAVLDAVGVEKAHIWGMSMGGMIVQTLAVEHPERVLSLTSVMSSTGSSKVGGATAEAQKVLMTVPPTDREGAIESDVAGRRVTGGSLFDEAATRALASAAYDRCCNPIGSAFQIAAITAAGNRTAALAAITAPTTVLHGRMDPLIQLSGGEATAAAIAGAELVVFDEMGHDIPEPLWDRYVEELDKLAARVA